MAGMDYVALGDQGGMGWSKPLRAAAGFLGTALAGAGWFAAAGKMFQKNGNPTSLHMEQKQGVTTTSAVFTPQEGVDAVTYQAGPGALQLIPPGLVESSSLFVYSGSVPHELQGGTGLTTSEAWIYGAKLEGESGNVAVPTGSSGDVLKGQLLTWPSALFKDKLKAADKLMGFSPASCYEGSVRRGVATVVKQDGLTVQAHWYYLEYHVTWPAVKAPTCARHESKITQHGFTRIDHYAWLRDEKWQDVLRDPSVLKPDIRNYLEDENDYYNKMVQEEEALRKVLVAEMRGRIKEDESSVPAKDGPYFYSARYNMGGQYPEYLRMPVETPDVVEIILDGDKESQAHPKYFKIGSISHSPDHKLLVWGVDNNGAEYYTLVVRDLATGIESDKIEQTAGDCVWSADSKSFFYVWRDENMRPKRVFRHVLGTDPSTDKLVYEEPDDGFFLDVSDSQSEEYIFIYSGNKISSEVRFLKADNTDAELTLLAPRKEDELYYPAHHGDYFYMVTNANGAVDYKIVRTPISSPGREHWEDVLPHRPGTYLTKLMTFQDYYVRLENFDALPKIVVSTWEGKEHIVSFDEAAFSVGTSSGYEYITDVFRFTYESPSTPRTTFEYNMKTRERKILKRQTVPSGHDPSLYKVERIKAVASDGAKVPVTILHLKSIDRKKCGPAPLVLYGYGSYGTTIPATFSTAALSLVDRGVVYAIAHIRGGAAMGRSWYLDGKKEKKMNTFTDFNTAAETLIEQGYTSKRRIVIYGGSAGGLLVGAAVNLKPELYGGVIGAVPFVDVLTTISDSSLPLTPPEWPEWGDPISSKEAYMCIAKYSPYDNIQSKVAYPPILATGGLTDPRVTYWEPAKWVARLRHDATGGPFLLRMNMDAGHGGSAARFKRMDETAHLYSFALKVLGCKDKVPVAHGGVGATAK
eukprot:gb/GEZN01001558.1/.p1 GENE.gb/GEZN01001558.1/~~gb/GEZN01001558.1/.p1  ORF type:complete len:920 (-),score=84.03 gb/GEZN01001558.1/:56-2815(-)